MACIFCDKPCVFFRNAKNPEIRGKMFPKLGLYVSRFSVKSRCVS